MHRSEQFCRGSWTESRLFQLPTHIIVRIRYDTSTSDQNEIQSLLVQKIEMKILKTILLFGVSSSLQNLIVQSVSQSNAESTADYATGQYNLHFIENCNNDRCYGSVKRTGNNSRKVKTITWKKCTKATIRLVFKNIP